MKAIVPILCWLCLWASTHATTVKLSQLCKCNGPITELLQQEIDESDTRLVLVLDEPDVELDQFTITDKDYLKIHAPEPCTIYLPEREFRVSTHSADYSGSWLEIKDCLVVEITGPVTLNGSRASFVMPTAESSSIGAAVHISTGNADRDWVYIDGFTNAENGYGGIRVSNKGGVGHGYQKVALRNLDSYNSPLNIAHVRGAHQRVFIQNIYAEDPNCKSVWHQSAAEKTISCSAEVGVAADHLGTVIIRDVESRYSTSGVSVQQACKSQLIENVRIDSRGYYGDGSPLDTYNGGPATKIDNVIWSGPRQATIRNFVTVNTNSDDGYLSAWVGQAGDQNIVFDTCDFDAGVNMPGISQPNRPGIEGWSRLGVIRNSIFRGLVKLGGGWGTVENCQFMGPTQFDPTVATSQHDDFDSAFGDTKLLELHSPDVVLRDCLFVGCRLMVQPNANGLVIERPKFLAGAQLLTANAYAGEITLIEPHNLVVFGQYNTAAQAGVVVVRDPINPPINMSNPNGPGGRVEVVQ